MDAPLPPLVLVTPPSVLVAVIVLAPAVSVVVCSMSAEAASSESSRPIDVAPMPTIGAVGSSGFASVKPPLVTPARAENEAWQGPANGCVEVDRQPLGENAVVRCRIVLVP